MTRLSSIQDTNAKQATKFFFEIFSPLGYSSICLCSQFSFVIQLVFPEIALCKRNLTGIAMQPTDSIV